jgi:cytoskeletal protein CcmA (bactofilin family)
MKKLVKVLFTTTCLSILFAACNDSNEKVIKGSYKKDKLESKEPLTIQGSLEVNELKVKKLTVQGYAKILGNRSNMVDGDLLVQGELEASNLTVNGKTKIQGDANVDGNSHFKKSFIVKGVATFTNTTVDGDVEVESKKIVLKNGVTINGFIKFINGSGMVSIEGNSIHLINGIINGNYVKNSGSSGTGGNRLDF